MKIDLITLHNVKNYGSVLQTYATQTILQKLNTEVEVINYFRKDNMKENIIEKRLKNSSFFSKNFLAMHIGKLFLTSSINKQVKVFDYFLDNYINLTKPYYSNEELKEDTPKADIYCTGSDQVWNSDWNQGIEKAFYLDFLKKNTPRFAYGASFGKTKIEDGEKEKIIELLKRYKRISVREKSAVDILRNMGFDNAIQVLDPTLLLNKQEWLELKEDIKIKRPYILVYQLNSNNPQFDKYVKKLSKKKKMPVIRISVVNYQILKYGKLAFCPSVNEFLSYFDKAEYIITDSFHATGFSINFNKKFICIFPEKFSTRLQNILDLTGLQERQVKDCEDYSIIDKEIDYKRVNKIIENERKKSIDFLRDTIKICKRGIE